MSGQNLRPRGLIVAIDGPSGAGKSTITRHLAALLDYVHIDTGAMYRALALAVSRSGVPADDDAQVLAVCQRSTVAFCRKQGQICVTLNGEDVSDLIRTPEISLLTSHIAGMRGVRELLLTLQREMGHDGGVVLEGRDIGTVVFPDADVKFFLSASPEERGRRRYLELKAKGELVDLERTIAEVIARDKQDTGRDHAPLRQAEDAIAIDSTALSIDQVVERMAGVVKERQRSAGPAAA